ncbi:MAG: NAD(+) diphosphatase [Thermoleophilaceae bacterium]
MPPNTFAGASLDRAAARRTDEAWLNGRLADPTTRALPVAPEGPYLHCEGDDCAAALVPLSEVADAAAELILLGVDSHGALFAATLDSSPALDGAAPLGLREAAFRVDQAEGGLLAYATALANWHRRHRFCANCGNATHTAEAGFVRACPRCGTVHHPRTDPVVIMLVHDGDRVLLGRQASWPPGRYSALAGFVEPGESLEEAVAREVREESGVAVDEPRYRSSQPWPFPSSLMLGFFARYAGGDARTVDAELEDVRWFSREELEAAARGEGDFLLPPPIAIARRLIDEWLG